MFPLDLPSPTTVVIRDCLVIKLHCQYFKDTTILDHVSLKMAFKNMLKLPKKTTKQPALVQFH